MITKELPIKSRLAELRETAGLTQSELARAVGVQQHSISNIEKGKHGISDATKARICAVLKCKFDDLLYISSAKEK